VGFLVIVAATTGLACGGSTNEGTATPVTTAGPPSDPDRARAPALEGITLDGEPISLSDFRGGPVLVNVWSSW
jgi:hypothetical protein